MNVGGEVSLMVMVRSAAEAMPLPATSKTAFCSMSSCGVVMLKTAERWVAVRVSVRVDPERAGVPLRVTPPLDSPVSRMCRRFGWAVSLSDSLKVMARFPLPVE